MARPINLLPSTLLVFVGAWVGCSCPGPTPLISCTFAPEICGARSPEPERVHHVAHVPPRWPQAGTGRTVQLLGCGTVWLVSVMSGSIAVASVVVNDYFDFISGADVVNAPSKVMSVGSDLPVAPRKHRLGLVPQKYGVEPKSSAPFFVTPCIVRKVCSGLDHKGSRYELSSHRRDPIGRIDCIYDFMHW